MPSATKKKHGVFRVGRTYVVTEQFTTPTLNGHEVGGSWEGGRVVELDPGNRFKIIGEQGDDSGWHIAEIAHNLRFASREFPGKAFTWKGQFYVRADCHRVRVKEHRGG